MFSACRVGGGEMQGADAAQDGTTSGSDGSQPALGMFVTWRADPSLPGVIDDKITVTDVTFQLDHFQVVGDAGNDMRTTHAKYLLTWETGKKPAQERFPEAPVGVYSKISVVMMTGTLSENVYEVHGTWTDSGMPAKRFEIRDRGGTLSLSIDCDKTLPANGMASLGVKLSLKDALQAIDFSMLDDEEGDLELKDGPQLAMFRDKLKKAFKLDDD